MNRDGTTDFIKDDIFPLILSRSNQFVKNSTEFTNAWNSIISTRETNFVSRLNTWKTNNNLTINILDNVFVFGNYKTTNWKIGGLEIKSLSLPYYITSDSTTRTSNTTESLKILEKLFVGNNSLFQWQKNWTLEWGQYNCNFAFNPDVYDDFIKRDVTVQTVDLV